MSFIDFFPPFFSVRVSNLSLAHFPTLLMPRNPQGFVGFPRIKGKAHYEIYAVRVRNYNSPENSSSRTLSSPFYMRYLIELFCRLHFISTPNRPTLRTRSRSNIVMLWQRQSWVKYFFFVWERSAKHAERERGKEERERIPRRVQRGKKVVVYVVCLASCSRRVLCNWEREIQRGWRGFISNHQWNTANGTSESEQNAWNGKNKNEEEGYEAVRKCWEQQQHGDNREERWSQMYARNFKFRTELS